MADQVLSQKTAESIRDQVYALLHGKKISVKGSRGVTYLVADEYYPEVSLRKYDDEVALYNFYVTG